MRLDGRGIAEGASADRGRLERDVGRDPHGVLDRVSARGFLLVRALGLAVGGDDQIVRGCVAIDQAHEGRPGRHEASARVIEGLAGLGRTRLRLWHARHHREKGRADRASQRGGGPAARRGIGRGKCVEQVGDGTIDQHATVLKEGVKARRLEGSRSRAPFDYQAPETSSPLLMTARIGVALTRNKPTAGPCTRTASICLPGSRLPMRSCRSRAYAALIVTAASASSKVRSIAKQASAMAKGREGEKPPPGLTSVARATGTPAVTQARAGANRPIFRKKAAHGRSVATQPPRAIAAMPAASANR